MRIAFVIPWFSMNIPGGAEAELRGLALHLQNTGIHVEILTTRVKQFAANWNRNYYRRGLSVEGGLVIRRFDVRKRNAAKFNDVNIMLMNHQKITREEEEIFIQESVNSEELYEYIRDNQKEYDLFAYIPYMFGTTYFGILACPEKSVLIPCLHDEDYAHMQIFRECFSKTAGMSFLSTPEKNLALKLYDLRETEMRVLGAGVDDIVGSKPDRFRRKYHIDTPFILYAGRKTAGKNVDILIQFFTEYRRRNDSSRKLVLIGGEHVNIPPDQKENIIDLGFVDTQDKYDAYSAAEVLCQPSSHESFSIVIMESWLCGRPVLVSGNCAVTKNFAIESNGGLWFQNYPEFEGALNYIAHHPNVASQMGINGAKYVRSHFMWDRIVENYIDFFNDLIARQKTARQPDVSE